MTWYDELDFVENPFTIKPRDSINEFIGHKQMVSQLKKAVESNNLVLIKGKYGTGKTSVLKSLINIYRGKGKVFYYNAFSSNKELDVDSVLRKAGGFFSRLFKVKSNNVVALIDEVHVLSTEKLEDLEDALDEGFFKSLILVTSELDYKVPKSVQVDKEFEMNMFSEEEAHKIVMNRLVDEHKMLPKEIVRELYYMSSTPREFLQNCEDACQRAIDSGRRVVKKSDIN